MDTQLLKSCAFVGSTGGGMRGPGFELGDPLGKYLISLTLDYARRFTQPSRTRGQVQVNLGLRTVVTRESADAQGCSSRENRSTSTLDGCGEAFLS